MKNTQNQKISQIKNETLVVGIDANVNQKVDHCAN